MLARITISFARVWKILTAFLLDAPLFDMQRESTPVLRFGLVFFITIGLCALSLPVIDYWEPRDLTHEEVVANTKANLAAMRQARTGDTPPVWKAAKREPQRRIGLHALIGAMGGYAMLRFTAWPIHLELRARRARLAPQVPLA
jgi:hypothetical protein